jgi:hypothetical protein
MNIRSKHSVLTDLTPSLGDGVGARRSEWGRDLRDAEIVQPPIEHLPVAAVVVMDESVVVHDPRPAYWRRSASVQSHPIEETPPQFFRPSSVWPRPE